jgi:hypothetical protein
MIRKHTSRLIVFVLLVAVIRLLWPTSSQLAALSASVKTLLRPTAVVFLASFNEPMTPILLSLGIILLALGSASYFVLVAEREVALLAGLAGRIQSLPRETIAADNALLTRSRSIERIVEDYPAVLADWAAYKSALLSGGLGQFLRPHVFITIDTVARRGLDLAFYSKIPSYFVGLGLLLTFMGLIAGLYYASSGMRAATLDDARNSLVLLLNAASFKFTTSVAGLGTSLFYALVLAFERSRITQALDTLCVTIEGSLGNTCSTENISHHLAETSKQLVLLNQHLRAITSQYTREGSSAL